MTPDGHRDTTTVELPAEQMDIVYEMLVRGMAQTSPGDREYGAAFDAFVEEGIPATNRRPSRACAGRHQRGVATGGGR